MDTKTSGDHLAISKKGGQQTLKKYGKKHYVRIAKKRWEKERAGQSSKR